MNGRGGEELCDQLPNQCVLLRVIYIAPFRFQILYAISKGLFGVKNQNKEFCFFHNFGRRFVQQDTRLWGKKPHSAYKRPYILF